MRPSAAFTLSTNIVLKALPRANKYYAFDTLSGDHFALNHTAQWVLETMKSPLPVADLIKDFAEEFGIPLERAEADLRDIIEFALSNCIIEEVRNEEDKENY